jgi:2-deoxy-D-gluconate 3-dehydrogenase
MVAYFDNCYMNSLDLTGKVALVTGAGRGLGRGIALSLAESGAQVILVSRTESQLIETANQINSIGAISKSLVFDIGQLDLLENFAETAWSSFGKIDILVHAAGIQLRKPALDFTVNEVKSIIDVNLLAPYFLSTAIGRRMIENKQQGRHIFIGSLASKIGLPNIVPYTISKSAILGAVNGLSREWASLGITVNAVLPGYFDTELTRNLLSEQSQMDRILSRIPMGHLGDPKDVASACTFLASDMARYITGVSLAVDGGWLAS